MTRVGRPRRLQPEQELYLYGLWRAGKRKSTIAAQWGISRQTLARLLVRVDAFYEGLGAAMVKYTGCTPAQPPESNLGHRRRPYRHFTRSLQDAAQRYAQEGRTVAEIMRLLECSERTVYYALRNLRQ